MQQDIRGAIESLSRNSLLTANEIPESPPRLVRQSAHTNTQRTAWHLQQRSHDNSNDNWDPDCRSNNNSLHMDTEKDMSRDDFNEEISPNIDEIGLAFRLLSGMGSVRRTHSRNIVPSLTCKPGFREHINQLVESGNYAVAWETSRYKTCHFFAKSGLDPIKLLPLLGENHRWSDCTDILYSLFNGRGIDILQYLAESDKCDASAKNCRHYAELFEMAIFCLPVNNDYDSDSDDIANESECKESVNKDINEETYEKLICKVLEIFIDEESPIAWPYILMLAKRFPCTAHKFIGMGSILDCSNTINVFNYRKYHPVLFDSICKKAPVKNIDAIVQMSGVIDVSKLVEDLSMHVGWLSVSERINDLVKLLCIHADCSGIIANLTKRLNGWQHIAISIVLFGHGLITYLQFISQIAIAKTKENVDKLPKMLADKLINILANAELPDSIDELSNLITLMHWKVTSISSPAAINLACRLNLEEVIANSPFTNIDFNSYLMNFVSTPPTTMELKRIYNIALIQDCAQNNRVEYLSRAICVFNDIPPVDSIIIVSLLLMAVRYMHKKQYAVLTTAIDRDSALQLIESLVDLLGNLTDETQIIRIVEFIRMLLERYSTIQLTSSGRRHLLKRHYLLSDTEIISIILQSSKDKLIRDTLPWIDELSISLREFSIRPNNNYSENAIRWNGSGTLELARENLYIRDDGWTIKNGEGHDYGGIRKEFFSSLGAEIAKYCDKVEEYLVPKPGSPASLMYDIGAIFGRSYFVDGHTLNISLHPFIHVMLCWPWILSPSTTPYPWLAIERLLGQEWLRELAPKMYYRIKDLNLAEREKITSQEMIEEMLLRCAPLLTNVLCMKIGFSRYRKDIIIPPRYLNMCLAGVGELHIDQLSAMLQTNGGEAVKDLLDVYAKTVIFILESWELSQQIRFYRFWFGTERPCWANDEPPKLEIVGLGGTAAISRTCFNQLEISRIESSDPVEIHDHVERQMLASLANQEIAEQAGLLYQMN